MATVGRTSTTASKATPPDSLPEVMSISGAAMGSTSVSVNRPGVEVGERLAQRLAADGRGSAHPGLDDSPGYLARPETGNPHLTGQPPHHLVQGFVDLRLVDLN